MWQFSVSMLLLPFFKKWGELGRHEKLFICTIRETETGNPRKTLFSIALAILGGVVMFSLLSIQMRLRTSKKNKQILYGFTDGKLNGKKMKRENQVTKISIIIVASFVILYIPNFMIEIFDQNWTLPGLHVAGYISCWCWVFVNPFIYVFGCSLYRSAFKLTYGLPMDSKDTTYLSGGAKFHRHLSSSNISRKGSLADIGSIIKNQSTNE